jgi:hypothetical protein
MKKQLTIQINPLGVDSIASDVLIAREEKFHCNMALRDLTKKSREAGGSVLPELAIALKRFSRLHRICEMRTDIVLDLVQDFGTLCEDTGAKYLVGKNYYIELEPDGRTLHVRMCATAE